MHYFYFISTGDPVSNIFLCLKYLFNWKLKTMFVSFLNKTFLASTFYLHMKNFISKTKIVL